ncbi:MAG: hypothetical protein JWL86_6306 [Rhizobium sp.]|nr:hypothetical protein [Rhizobium sp.]
MFNAGDLFVSVVVGLALPLAILDGLRMLAGSRMPVQHDGFQIETRLSPWLLAVIAGPGLLVEKLIEGWKEQSLDAGDLPAGAFIAVGWATIYGYAVLRGVQFVLPM